MTEILSKNTLREQAKFHRDRVEVLPEMGEQAASEFSGFLGGLPKHAVLAGYWPKGKEFDIRPILDDAMGAGLKIAMPKAVAHAQPMDFLLWDGQEELVKSSYGVMEPKGGEKVRPDIMLVPLLAFDRHGYRLGYGGGHYDASLSALRAEKPVIAIGVGYASQAVLFNLPIEKHDQKLDYILTEKELRKMD